MRSAHVKYMWCILQRICNNKARNSLQATGQLHTKGSSAYCFEIPPKKRTLYLTCFPEIMDCSSTVNTAPTASRIILLLYIIIHDFCVPSCSLPFSPLPRSLSPPLSLSNNSSFDIKASSDESLMFMTSQKVKISYMMNSVQKKKEKKEKKKRRQERRSPFPR